MDVPTSEAGKQFSEILNRAAHGKERVVLTRCGKPLAAAAPIEDIEALEAMFDRIDIEEATRSLGETRRGSP